ncbi:MAG TPA: hypothetical protein DDZ66_15455 [Firmicutes bacterium]|nr:hypothetical protein [Bacillota bacterium]
MRSPLTVKVVFDRRLCWLLLELSNSDSYQPIKNLAQNMHCSRRSVEYDILRLNSILDELGLDKVKAVPSKGVLLSDKNKLWFNELTQDFQGRITYVYSQDERLAYCLSLIIIGGHNYNTESLASLFQVSRATIFQDLRRVQDVVAAHEALLSYDRFYKYYIQATGKQYIDMLRIAADIMYESVPKEILQHILDKDVVEMMTRISMLRSDDPELQSNLKGIIAKKQREKGGDMEAGSTHVNALIGIVSIG